ncbi:G-type lectin S-receptor-like serine/threonine-protein kinase RLK1 [Morella rubra]|uniref:G-type lectin S-receptor-like serine/threonine-protein kinase RLK1 n=1 Tax=Morella rubra TaxID=262757 RepID=A0A6A1WWH7_9ROSI|nr:G-type lectin S-receptor-like serine/threonine-protein kinase RLK1 [Morella rubra]
MDMESDGAEEKAILTDWAYDCYREGTLDALVEYDEEALDDRKKLERFVMIAIWCIQEDPSLRPTMRKVTQMLEEVVEVRVPPCPCPFTKTV